MSLLLGQNELVQILRYFVILDSKAADLAFLRWQRKLHVPRHKLDLSQNSFVMLSNSAWTHCFCSTACQTCVLEESDHHREWGAQLFEMYELVTCESVNPIFSSLWKLVFFCPSEMFFSGVADYAGMLQMAIFHQPSPSLGFQVITDQVWISIWCHSVGIGIASPQWGRPHSKELNTYRTGNWAQTFGTWQWLFLWESVMFTQHLTSVWRFIELVSSS